MTVTSVEELDALPSGARINVSGVAGQGTWEKTAENLWSANGAAVKASNFVGVIAAGALEVARPVAAGDLYASGPSHYLVLGLTPDEQVVCGRWRRNLWLGTEILPQENLLRATRVAEADRPDWYAQSAQACLAAYQAGLANTPAPPAVKPVSDEAREALHAYAVGANDAAFEEVLARLGIGREVDHISTVRITGHSLYVLPAQDAASWLGGAVGVTSVDTSVVSWVREVQISKRGIGCQCETVTRDDVLAYLPPSWEEFEFEVTH